MQKILIVYDEYDFYQDAGKKYREVRDHCHGTGKYKGATYNIWNLRYKARKKSLQYFIMVLNMTFHNQKIDRRT